eukprot:scaffold3243_cov106-Isochrysis_galbana.AAC.6
MHPPQALAPTHPEVEQRHLNLDEDEQYQKADPGSPKIDVVQCVELTVHPRASHVLVEARTRGGESIDGWVNEPGGDASEQLDDVHGHLVQVVHQVEDEQQDCRLADVAGVRLDHEKCKHKREVSGNDHRVELEEDGPEDHVAIRIGLSLVVGGHGTKQNPAAAKLAEVRCRPESAKAEADQQQPEDEVDEAGGDSRGNGHVGGEEVGPGGGARHNGDEIWGAGGDSGGEGVEVAGKQGVRGT